VADLQLGSTTAFLATAGTSATGELAVFTNPNGPASPGAYTALINWGDGSALSGASIIADPNVSGAFDISGTHNYAGPGTYSGTIELHAAGTGQSLTIPLSATARAPSVSATTGIQGISGQPTGDLTVATVSVPFFLGSPGLDYHGYSASIDYGDGSPAVPATLAPASVSGATAFAVSTSGHSYATPGSYTLTVAIRDAQGVIVGTGTATVAINDPPAPTPTPAPVLTWGRLSPQSDSGVNNSDGITNVTTPTFVGGATPGAVIEVYATPTGSTASPVPIASGVANNAGLWSATVVGSPMAQGSFQISARATTSGGTVSSGLGTVVIDTTAPVITNIVFNRRQGELDVYFRDNLSGMFLPAISNGASYQVSARPLNDWIPVRRVIVPTSVSVIAGATPSSVDEAVVVLNHGKRLNPGHYTVQVAAGGMFDVAGNLLGGRFYGSYPTGNGVAGTNYVAQFTAFPARTLAAFPFQTGYARPKMPAFRLAAPQVGIAGAAVSRTQARTLARQAGAWSDHAKHDPASFVDQAIASLDGIHPKRRR
ncbi:MAG: Ig-like domain-containing protein, partial [Isosphaeraceae bacterium]